MSRTRGINLLRSLTQEMCGRVESLRGYDSNVIQFDAFTHTISRSQPAFCYTMEINNLAQSLMVQGTVLKYYSTQPEAAAFNIYNL